MRATEKIYNNLYATEMRYGKIDIPQTCTFSCFFIVEDTFDTDYISQQIMDLLVAGCRNFIFYGEYGDSWKNTVDELATKMLTADEGIRVMESQFESDFVEELFEAISLKSFVPNIALLVYDDETQYRTVLDQLFWLLQKGPLFHFVKNALNEMNPFDLLPDAPADEFYKEAECIASKILTNDSVKHIASYIAEELSRSFGEVFTEDECMRAAEMVKEKMQKVHIMDNVQYTEEQLNMSIYEFFNPIILDQKPFLRDDMTVREYLEELQYYGENFDKVLKRSYLPLWKQMRGSEND